MTLEEIARVESTLGVRLPDVYRQVLLAPPYAADSWAAFCIADSADFLLANNREQALLQQLGVESPERYLCIGNDGATVRYFLDLDSHGHPVYALELARKNTSFKRECDSFTGWIEKMQAEEAVERRQEAERVAHRRWWAFWR